MNLSRLITGLLISVFGLFIIYEEFNLITLIFGGGFIAVGVFILFNSKEDKIEEIKK